MTTRRDFLASTAAGLAAAHPTLHHLRTDVLGSRPTPSSAQLAWQRDELAMFVHFGVNTFTDREWGDGTENPAIFNPTQLDARQWARSARAAGFKAMILTAKHHDGFCLWPTRTTTHSVASSPFRGGHGDVVREFVDACRAEHLKAGLYLSPWDRNAPSYGDSPRYNDFYAAQLTELLSHYGPISEVWFDGANGEGPNGRKQAYDWPRVWGIVRKLQPHAVIFSDAGPDIRWIGNENGIAAETNWSTVNPAVVPYPGASGDEVTQMLQHGDPSGSVWRPGEADVSIRPGWFYHAADDEHVKTPDQLVDLYFSSVGRNSKLLLNVPPNRAGQLPSVDIDHLAGMRRQLDALFVHDVLQHRTFWWDGRANSAVAEANLGRMVPIALSDIAEDIGAGQLVRQYVVEGFDGELWHTLADGTTIGYRKLDRFRPVTVRRVRVRIPDALDRPHKLRMHFYTPG
jgi:alpha-L-fucosidase